jgi:hypothetical protein
MKPPTRKEDMMDEREIQELCSRILETDRLRHVKCHNRILELEAEVERLQAKLLRVENALEYSMVEVPARVVERVREAIAEEAKQ